MGDRVTVRILFAASDSSRRPSSACHANSAGTPRTSSATSLDERQRQRDLGRHPEDRACGDQGAVLHAESAGQGEGGSAAPLSKAFDCHRFSELTGCPMKASAIQTSIAPTKNDREVNEK